MPLTYDMARNMIDAAVAEARSRGLGMTISVVDSSGTLVAMARLDGANVVGPEVSRGKAFGSAAFRVPSGELAERAEKIPAFYTSLTTLLGGRFVAAQGALPVFVDGQCVGAIGASGSKPDVDEEIARAGLAGLGA